MNRLLELSRQTMLLALVMFLLVVAACGGSAAPAEVVEKEVVKEITKEVIVEKEVVKEVQVEVVKLVTATPVFKPTAVPAAAAAAGTGAYDWVRNGIQGGRIDLYMSGNPEQWDTHRGATRGTLHPTASLYNGLVMYSPEPPTNVIIGDLATHWDVDATGDTYTFHLHEDAKWSDGRPVTADDVVFSLDRMVEQGQPRPRTGALKPYYESSRMIDPKTVEVELKFPAAAFLPFMGVGYMVIMPKHVVEAGVDIGVPANIVGSGAFLQDGFDRGVSWAFERNPDYFKEGLPFLDHVNVVVITDKGRAIAAMLTEQVMGYAGWGSAMTSREYEALHRDSGGRLVAPSVTTGYGGLFLQFEKAPFSDPKVRKAIYLALDRQEIAKAAFGVGEGKWLPATVFVPGSVTTGKELAEYPGHRYTSDGNKDPRDLEEAKKLLADAGYPDGFEAEIQAGTRGLDLVVPPFFKKQLAEIGIKLEIVGLEGSVVRGNRDSGKYEMQWMNHGISLQDADEVFTSTYLPLGSRNQVGYEDPRVTEIFKRQTRELDLEQRGVIQREARDIIMEGEGHWFTLFWYFGFAPKNVKIGNWNAPPSIHVLQTHEFIWYDPDAKP